MDLIFVLISLFFVCFFFFWPVGGRFGILFHPGTDRNVSIELAVFKMNNFVLIRGKLFGTRGATEATRTENVEIVGRWKWMAVSSGVIIRCFILSHENKNK